MGSGARRSDDAAHAVRHPGVLRRGGKNVTQQEIDSCGCRRRRRDRRRAGLAAVRQRSGISKRSRQTFAGRHVVGAGDGFLGLHVAHSGGIVRRHADLRARWNDDRDDDESGVRDWPARPRPWSLVSRRRAQLPGVERGVRSVYKRAEPARQSGISSGVSAARSGHQARRCRSLHERRRHSVLRHDRTQSTARDAQRHPRADSSSDFSWRLADAGPASVISQFDIWLIPL